MIVDRRLKPIRRQFGLFSNQQSGINNGFLLYGRPAAKLEQNLAHGLGEWTIDRASAGAFVTAAAESFGDMSHVELALAAQAYAVSASRQLAEKRRHFDASDRKNVVHQPFAVFVNGAAAIHLLLGHPSVADGTFQAQISQGLTQQPDLPDRVREINAARAVLWIRARQDKLARQRKSILIRALKHERTSVSHERRVEASGDLG